jgi:PTS system N-acetylgalactosamine-specific IIA component
VSEEADVASTGIRAIVAGHGAFATGIISAVDQITGHGHVFRAISNSGLCLDDIQELLNQTLDETGAKVIFTDLPAGSCTMAVRRLLRGRPGVSLITGINLALLLDFALNESADAAAAALTALERGKASMVAHGT